MQKLRFILSIYTIFFVSCQLFTQVKEVKQSPIIPNPTVFIQSEGEIEFSSDIAICNLNLPLEIQIYLQNQLKDLFKIKCNFNSENGLIQFKKIVNVPTDSYTINITDNILITYSSDASCFYAVTSLIQLIESQSGINTISKCFVSDSPKFEWRGMHLDVSRHFFTVEEVKKMLDLMAFYKFNKFHWHLTDDQGWRIEIKQFPKLTAIGAWRDSTVIGHANTIPNQYNKQREGGFYTQDQIKDIVKYAQNKYITIIPEIEMPGHARAALAAYPEFSCTGKQHGVEGLWGVFDDIYCSKKESIDFNLKILEEVLTLFPSEYIHIGGDEAPKTRWKECANCQKVMKENNIKDEHALQSYFIQQIDRYLTAKGRKLIGWDEILEGGLSPNATVMSWRGEQGGIEAAKQKHFVVMSPSSHCYFDHYQTSSSTEPLAIGGYLTLEKVYTFNPIPSALTAQETVFVLGGQANLWTEYIPNMKQLEYMMFPRALAMAQSLWCTNKPNYKSFENELVNHQFRVLSLMKVNYSKAILYPKTNLIRTNKGIGLVVSSIKQDEKFEIEMVENPIVSYSNPSVIKTLTSKDTLFFDRLSSSNNTKLATITIKSDVLKKPLRIEVNTNSTIGLPVSFATSPNVKFNNRGDLALVDGIRGARPWKGDEWLGFDQDTIEFTLDLLAVKKIKECKIGFLMANGSWIYLPKNVTIFLSKDNEHWNSLHKSKATEYFSQFVFKKARYVKVKVVSNSKIPEGKEGAGFHPWTFIDEIEIITK